MAPHLADCIKIIIFFCLQQDVQESDSSFDVGSMWLQCGCLGEKTRRKKIDSLEKKIDKLCACVTSYAELAGVKSNC